VFRYRGFDQTGLSILAGTLKKSDMNDNSTHIIQQEPKDHVAAVAGNIIGRESKNGGNGLGVNDDGSAYTLTKADQYGVAYKTVIRRLTPLECERLQGFPDEYTNIRGASNAKRYAALGAKDRKSRTSYANAKRRRGIYLGNIQ
jgi:site-specific DNA-cytosine methylase